MTKPDLSPIKLLRQLTANPNAEFREGQLEAIKTIVEDSGRALVVQRTGWGKSAVYFIATRLLRNQGHGPTVIVSPLLILMRNQAEMAERVGIAASRIDSSNEPQHAQVVAGLSNNEVDLLLVSPERFSNEEFEENALPWLLKTFGLLVIDEAHCISDWGHDFRPDYQRLGQLVDALAPDVPVLGTTATANARVVRDVAKQLGADLDVYRGTLDRESLALFVIHMPDPAERLAWLASRIPDLSGTGIIYCLTKRDAERVGSWLQHRKIKARVYTGDTSKNERLEIERLLTDGGLTAVVATSAMAMGYDNPHIEWVIHYQTPGSAIAYYQQVGRAGRAVDRAVGIALVGSEDKRIQDWFISSAFPTEKDVLKILSLLAKAGTEGLSLQAIQASVNLGKGRLESILRLLSAEGAVYKKNNRWRRSAKKYEYPKSRTEDVTATRVAEQEAMLKYLTADECLMQFLRRELDDLNPEPCGRCQNCTDSLQPTDLDESLVQEALEFTRQGALIIEPRKQMPCGLGLHLKLSNHNMEEGRALSKWGDPGWAYLTQQGKYDNGYFSDDLVIALAEMIENWCPDPTPTWVTSIPSSTGRGLVEDFARRVADLLDLPFVESMLRLSKRPPQKTLQNSCHQARNVVGAFEVAGVQPGPVLLVDDMVDSRWTMTIAGHLLRQAGSGPVYPVALADTSRSNS